MKVTALIHSIIMAFFAFPICSASQNVSDNAGFDFRQPMYRYVNNLTWHQLLEANRFKYRPSYTINLQIQPVHSPDWIYVNPSMVVSRRTVTENAVESAEKLLAAQTQEDMVLQFALDDPAFVPNFRLTNIKLKENRYPIATADYYANDLYYRIQYTVAPIDETQNILCINVTVHNESANEKDAVVRAKLGYYPENKIFNYHYIPYCWHADNWKPYTEISMLGNDLLKKGRKIGQVIPNTMHVEWEKNKTYTDKNYEDILYPQVWFGSGYVLPEFRLKDIQDVVLARKKLQPQESAGFFIKLLVDDRNVTAGQLDNLSDLSPAAIEKKALQGFRNEFKEDVVQLDFKKNQLEDILTELQLSIKQLLISYPDKDFFQTSQGGTSERFQVWVFEAVHMLRPMLRTGQFADVKSALDFIFSLQDGGYPPVGKFTTTEGAVGTTGPRWANTTGMALVLACEYYLYTHDEAFLQQFLPKILKAIHWIEGEVKATRKLRSDGSRPLTYGLMPFAVGCDGDNGFCVSDTDVFTFWGFNKTVDLLESIHHPEAEKLRKELEQYHKDLLYAIDHLKRRDGGIDRIILQEGVKQDIQPKFEVGDAMTPIALTGIMDPENRTFQSFISFCELHYADDFFMGGMDREIMYTNQNEHYWGQVYLKLGEWKKAFVSTQTCLLYGMSQDAYQTSERLSKRDPSFAPWQPNGSANGRIIDMILNMLYYEDNAQQVTILGPMPFLWLLENQRTSLHHLHTLTGVVNMDITANEGGSCTVQLTSDHKLPERLRIPARFGVKVIKGDVRKSTSDIYKIKGTEVTLRLTNLED
ncbi:MAG: hypothetical protein AB2L20_17920 [Mangrovibacterium sp.]